MEIEDLMDMEMIGNLGNEVLDQEALQQELDFLMYDCLHFKYKTKF